MRKQIGASLLALLTVTGACDRQTPTAPTAPTVAGNLPRITAFSPSPLIQSDDPQLITVFGVGFDTGLSVKVTDPSGSLPHRILDEAGFGDGVSQSDYRAALTAPSPRAILIALSTTIKTIVKIVTNAWVS